jgi:tetratricopeptide (TPR) repeat protein
MIAATNLFQLLGAVDESSAAFQQGKIIGAVVASVLPIIGIGFLVAGMRKPGVQPLGPLSMICFLIVWVIGSIMGNFKPGPVTMGLFSVFALLLLGAAFVLAILALVLFSKNRDRYHSGRRSAIWTIVLSCLFFCGILGTFLYETIKSVKSPPGSGKKVSDSDQALIRFEELNFEFDMPSRPWFSMDAKKVNPIAALMIQKGGENIVFMVIAERGGVDVKVNSDDLADIVIQNAESVYEDAKAEKTGVTVVEGIEFTKISVSRLNGIQTIHQRIYAGTKNGFYFQLIAGSNRHPERLEPELKRLAERFRLIDPDAICHSTGKPFTELVTKPELGLTADFRGLPWAAWDSISNDFAEGDFGVIHDNSTMFSLISFDLRGHVVSDEELAAACLYVAWGQTEFPDEMEGVNPFESGEFKGLEMEMFHQIDGTKFRDRIRVFQHEGRGWFLIYWSDETDDEKFSEMASVLDAIKPIKETVSESDAKLTAKQLEVRASIFNRIGLNRFKKKDYAGSVELFKTASAIDTDVDFAVNVSTAYTKKGNFQEALNYLLTQQDRFSKNPKWVGEVAWCLGELGESEKAIEKYREAFALDSDDEDYLIDYVNLLIDSEKTKDALAAVERFEEKHASDNTLRWKANLLDQLDRTDESISLLTERLDKKPFDSSIAYSLAQFYLDKDAAEKCIETCDLMVEKGEDTWDVAWLRGHAHMTLKRYRDAKAAYEHAVELNPENSDLKHSLARASAALGEGNNSLVKQKIDPIPIPAVLQTLLDGAEPAPNADIAGAEILSRVRLIEHRPGQPRRETTYSKVKITSEKGIEDFKTLESRFDPFAERLFVNRVVVRGEDGTVLGEGSVNDVYVIDEANDSMATEDQVLHVPVPGLRIGSILELELSRQDLGVSKSFDFTSELFHSSYPIRLEALGITGDVESLKVFTQGNLQTIEEKDFRGWLAAPSTQIDFEALQSPLDQFVPGVWLADNKNNWKSLAQGYVGELGDLFSKLPADVEVAAGRVLGQERVSLEESVRKLSQFVRSELTYKAIEFGPRGRIPVDSARTLRNRYGDCKDHSLLLHHLLKAHGIQSHLALVHFDAKVHNDLPDLDQFNHMILYVPEFGEGQFIDCTDDYLNPGSFPPDYLGEKTALILDPDEPRLQQIPAAGDGARSVTITRRLTLENNDLQVEEEVVLENYLAARLRAFFGVRDPKEQRNAFQQTFNSTGFRVNNLNIVNLGSVEEPLRIEAQYTLIDAMKNTGEMVLPGTWEKLYLSPEFVPERRSPFHFESPIEFKTELIWSNPSQTWTLADAEGFAKGGDGTFGIWRQEISDDGNKLKWSFKRGAGTFEPSMYQEYFGHTELSLAIWDRGVRLVP